MQNGEVLKPDHGYPLRVIIPGFIGGRMVKWLRKILVKQEWVASPTLVKDVNLCGSRVSSRWKDLETLGKEIGYLKFNRMCWHEPTVIEFDHGLHEIQGDRDINDMCDYTMMHNLSEIHIYLDHPADVPIAPEEVMSGSSSSSDSYESAEDV
ncbi:Nitrate reductase [NADH] 1 [Stylosanthes scabra]|uniref:Nitrate reductase [NADH] 1 n=1 Tax=Stylosanthes scabra TaxID=79078 RepID=A0ABU6WCA4_9FABA|nr:Nitrate reductase [NADH] 1 [Stylosanthes scabra]